MSDGVTVIPNAEVQKSVLRRKAEECHKILEEEKLSADNVTDAQCAGVWDGILCWRPIAAGQEATQLCPGYFSGFHTQANASRLCLEDGNWFVNPATNMTYTNYTQCYSSPLATFYSPLGGINDSYLEEYTPLVHATSRVGYPISLVTLVIAFYVLASIKKLRCPRNMLHMHLFVSFIMRALMAILKDSLFVHGVGMSTDLMVKDGVTYFYREENWQCKLFTTFWQYFIMANYSWILMEGLYLHNLIFLALVSDSSAITLYLICGWGLPALFVTLWALCRAFLEDEICWTLNSNSYLFFLIKGPTMLSVLINFGLFINIVRVLLLKLRSSVCDETKTYRKWAKSTLVLVPLFGVHYVIYVVFMGWNYGLDSRIELIWLFCDQLFASFQGFFVAVLYCFLNGEVRTELLKKWKQLPACTVAKPRPSCYTNTTSMSLSQAPATSWCSKRRSVGNQRQANCYNNIFDANQQDEQRRSSRFIYNLQDSPMELHSLTDQ